MAGDRTARTYRLEPLDASGVFLGLGVVQCALLGGGIALGIATLTAGALLPGLSAAILFDGNTAPDAATTAPPWYAASSASNRADSFSTERRCNGEPSARYTNFAERTTLATECSSASVRWSTDSVRTFAPSSAK